MIDFPQLPSGDTPTWDGSRFIVGDHVENVIAYSTNLRGWDEGLTALHEAEAGDGTHPIDLMSRRAALESLRAVDLPPGAAVLEIGCSSGFLLRDMKHQFPTLTLVGSDTILNPLTRLAASLHGVPLVQMDIMRCPLPDAQFEVVIALNVLEHIEDDSRALEQISRLLKPGGVLILEVPQGPGLYDYFDAYLRHCRRYDRQELQAKLRKAAMRVEKTGAIGFMAYAPFSMVKRVNRMRYGIRGERARNIEQLVREQINRTARNLVLDTLLRLERSVSSWGEFLPGIRCTAVARKSP